MSQRARKSDDIRQGGVSKIPSTLQLYPTVILSNNIDKECNKRKRSRSLDHTIAHLNTRTLRRGLSAFERYNLRGPLVRYEDNFIADLLRQRVFSVMQGGTLADLFGPEPTKGRRVNKSRDQQTPQRLMDLSTNIIACKQAHTAVFI